MRGPAPRPAEERFWAKVDKSGECWEWTAAKTPAGYGMFNVRIGTKRSQRCAHRVSYELSCGEIPAGMDIDHVCRNRGCVRPEHLRPATRKQNTENLSGARRDSGTGVRGVRWDRTKNRFIAQVVHNRKWHYAGRFKDLASAEAAVIAKRNELFTHNDADRAAAALEAAE